MKITAAWFEERGGLHDAKVVEAKVEATTIRIAINDERANEHDGGEKRSPGTLVFEAAVILAGDVTSLAGGWLSEIEYRGDVVAFDFCDRDRLVIEARAAHWEPSSD